MAWTLLPVARRAVRPSGLRHYRRSYFTRHFREFVIVLSGCLLYRKRQKLRWRFPGPCRVLTHCPPYGLRSIVQPPSRARRTVATRWVKFDEKKSHHAALPSYGLPHRCSHDPDSLVSAYPLLRTSGNEVGAAVAQNSPDHACG